MSVTNTTDELRHSYPFWYFINDSLVIVFNAMGILIGLLFVYAVVRLDHPSYSISNLVACKTCLAIGLLSSAAALNSCYALASDFRGAGSLDSFCILRGTLFTILHVNMYISLCFKAFNRLRCIVYRIRPVTSSYRSLMLFILLQWIVVILLVLPVILSNGIGYDWNAHLCLVTLNKTWQLIYLMIIYYVSIVFIAGAYIYILYYVLHLPLLERYRRSRQKRLLRRILILLFMLVLPGIAYVVLILYWLVFRSVPVFSLKVTSLIDSIGRVGAVITIFISNTRLRHQCYRKPKTRTIRSQRGHPNLLVLPPARRKVTIIQSSFTLEKIPVHVR